MCCSCLFKFLGPDTRLFGLLISELISWVFVSLAFIFFHVGSGLSMSWISTFFNSYIVNIGQELQSGNFSTFNNITENSLVALNNNFIIFQQLLLTLFCVYISSKLISLILFLL